MELAERSSVTVYRKTYADFLPSVILEEIIEHKTKCVYEPSGTTS